MFDFPNAPTVGQIVSGPNSAQWSWDGTKWLVAASNQPLVTISDTPPSLVPGSLWWDSLGGNLYVRYSDQDSTAWVTTTNLTGLANTATKQDVAGALSNVGRSLIHNSMMNIQQRGQGAWTAFNNYTADRWMTGGQTDTISYSIVTLTDADRAAIGDEAAQYALQNVFTGNVAANSYNELQQRVETTRRLANKTIILSFWARATVGTPRLSAFAIQGFGTGGSPSASVVVNFNLNPTLSPTWTRYVGTALMPSVAGKTFGTTAGSDYTSFNLRFSDTTNWGFAQSGTVQLWGVQAEVAQPGQTQPSPLEKLDYMLQVLQCQRFYLLYSLSLMCLNAAGSYSSSLQNVMYPVPMRATPTVTWQRTGGLGAACALSNGAGQAYAGFWMGAPTPAVGDYSSYNVQLSADL